MIAQCLWAPGSGLRASGIWSPAQIVLRVPGVTAVNVTRRTVLDVIDHTEVIYAFEFASGCVL